MDKKVDIYRFLGLPSGSPREAVARRCEELLDWLGSEGVPSRMKEWASNQRALIQELYDRLELAEEGDQESPAVEEATVSVAAPEGKKGGVGLGGLFSRLSSSSPVVLAAVGVAAALAVVVGVLWWQGIIFGGGDAAKTPPGDQTATDTFDPAKYLAEQQGRIAELKKTVAANPSNADTLFELGETYITGNDWSNSIIWFEKYIALKPDDLHALTDLGTAYMNLGQSAQAEGYFKQVLAKDPNDTQAYFNIGFLMAFRTDAPDLNKAVESWKEVIRLAPSSDLAQVAQIHIDQFAPMIQGSK